MRWGQVSTCHWGQVSTYQIGSKEQVDRGDLTPTGLHLLPPLRRDNSCGNAPQRIPIRSGILNVDTDENSSPEVGKQPGGPDPEAVRRKRRLAGVGRSRSVAREGRVASGSGSSPMAVGSTSVQGHEGEPPRRGRDGTGRRPGSLVVGQSVHPGSRRRRVGLSRPSDRTRTGWPASHPGRLAAVVQREGRPRPVLPDHESSQGISIRGFTSIGSAGRGRRARRSGQEPGLASATGGARRASTGRCFRRGHRKACGAARNVGALLETKAGSPKTPQNEKPRSQAGLERL